MKFSHSSQTNWDNADPDSKHAFRKTSMSVWCVMSKPARHENRCQLLQTQVITPNSAQGWRIPCCHGLLAPVSQSQRSALPFGEELQEFESKASQNLRSWNNNCRTSLRACAASGPSKKLASADGVRLPRRSPKAPPMMITSPTN